MKQLLFALLFIPALLFAQEDQHYLAGAVPVADGKVVFTREINAPSLSKAQIYQQLLKWGQDRVQACSLHSMIIRYFIIARSRDKAVLENTIYSSPSRR